MMGRRFFQARRLLPVTRRERALAAKLDDARASLAAMAAVVHNFSALEDARTHLIVKAARERRSGVAEDVAGDPALAAFQGVLAAHIDSAVARSKVTADIWTGSRKPWRGWLPRCGTRSRAVAFPACAGCAVRTYNSQFTLRRARVPPAASPGSRRSRPGVPGRCLTRCASLDSGPAKHGRAASAGTRAGVCPCSVHVPRRRACRLPVPAPGLGRWPSKGTHLARGPERTKTQTPATN